MSGSIFSYSWLCFSPIGEDKLRFDAGLRSCRAGTYFCFATKVGKNAPKREGTPFQAVSPLSLETLTSSAERGTPPRFARWLTLSSALTYSRGERYKSTPAPRGLTLRNSKRKKPSLAPVSPADMPAGAARRGRAMPGDIAAVRAKGAYAIECADWLARS